MITPDTKKYWKNLAQIPWSKRGEIRTKLVPWIYTNDHKFDELIPKIHLALNTQNRSGKPRAAVLSGVGSILNIAPWIDVDFFVSVDRNSFILDQVRRMVQNVQDASTVQEYDQIDQRETMFADLAAMGSDPKPYFDIERESFSLWHFTKSHDLYQLAKKRMTETPVYYTQGNFAHRPYVQALGQALDGVDVTYASFTDLGEWSPEFLDVAHYLPTIADSVIVWSTNQGQPEGKPLARMSIGLDQYISQQTEALVGNDVKYFQSHI